MPFTAKVLIGLIAGLALGIIAAWSRSEWAMAIALGIEPVGTLFINAIRMTVVPLVAASLVVGVAGAPDARAVGRVGRGALPLFIVLLVVAASATVLLARPAFELLPLDPAASAAMRESAAGAAGAIGERAREIPTFAQWLVALVPVNPVKAAADGALLPLIIFSILLGLACTRIDSARREAIVGFFGGVADASLVLVGWVLATAPIGVFALAVPLAARLGFSAAGALAGYIVVVSGLTIVYSVVVLYPLATIGTGVSLSRFARAALPAQAVAFSSRSSLAALPAMIEAARTELRLGETIASFFLPLAASTFRVGGAIGQTAGVLFIARLYGVPLDPAQLATIVVTVVLTTFSVPGVPAGSIIVMVPVLLAAGVPTEGIGILLGVDTIPDMFRTTGNVTADLATATVLRRRAGEEPVTASSASGSDGHAMSSG